MQLSLPHGMNKNVKEKKLTDTRDKSSPVPWSWRQSIKKVKLRWEGFIEKVGFEPGVKQWRSDGWREWRWWQRSVDKWM